ncbi:hypothetical protein PRZ48_011087 [Zasmidium cellare]|uniref:Kinetochore protein mis14 n=1 Tax=Zasmidium cellare TaxID=395010 RepID=A0ABR0EAE9_ZASCE|nr:hypothetical protein PRZ48_011087 [Zasmidium cellare]
MAAANIYETDAPQNGERATENTHRKVELQSPADLTYLIANVSRAAREKIDRHLPPDAAPEGEDAMRRRVEQLVDDYIRNTFNSAKDSISINGMDSREMERELEKAQEGEELEPFDSKLAQRIQALSAQIEDQTLQLANLRRKAPQETARTFIESFERQSEEYDARLKADREAKLEAAKATKMDVGEVERVDEMQGTWQRGAEDLARLKEGLGETVGRMEKARRAVDVVGER